VKGLFFSNEYKPWNPATSGHFEPGKNGRPPHWHGQAPWEDKGFQACAITVLAVGTAAAVAEYYFPGYIDSTLTRIGIGRLGAAGTTGSEAIKFVEEKGPEYTAQLGDAAPLIQTSLDDFIPPVQATLDDFMMPIDTTLDNFGLVMRSGDTAGLSARTISEAAQPALSSYEMSISQYESTLGSRFANAALTFNSHPQDACDIANFGADLFGASWESRAYTS
jgi:hypothetical protein